MNISNRDSFSSKFGVIAAAAGSAVGLGNIWRFPYLLGQNGGAAFLITYLVIAFLVGIPIMMSEMIIGRKAQRNVIGAFKHLTPGKPWFLIGVMGVGAAFLIMSFYSIVGGWTLEYIYSSAVGAFTNRTPAEIQAQYQTYTSGFWRPLFWMVLFMLLNVLIVLGGVKDGIEKYSKILMPLLFVLLVFLMIRSLTLPGAMAGVDFLFRPDFTKINSKVILDALGQVFFSMSIGMGVMATYGSYVSKKEKLGTTSVWVSMTDTTVAVLASLVIFPAVFAFGLQPDSGPGLVFVTLPNIFGHMSGGIVFGVIFFSLLAIAALTSTISLLEVVVAYFTEELKMKRNIATWLAAGTMTLLSILCIKFSALFSGFEFLTANIMLPLGGLFIVLFVVWQLKKIATRKELEESGHQMKLFPVFWLIIKYLAPVAIAFVFLNGLGFFGQ